MRKTAGIAALFVAGALVAPFVALADSSINITGSTAMLPLVKEAAATYQAKHPDVKIAVSGTGSGTGITQVAAKSVDIGDSDILAAGQSALVDHKVAVTGFAVVAHPGVGVTNLTKKQLQDIFSGKTQSWKEVGGADVKVTVINRPRNSGTRSVFTKTIMGDVPLTASGLTEDQTGSVVATVKTTPGSISYAAFAGARNQGLTEMKIDGVAPTEDNVMSGKYPVWSYEHMFTNGPPTPDVARFIEYVSGSADLVRKAGFIVVHDMKVSETDR